MNTVNTASNATCMRGKNYCVFNKSNSRDSFILDMKLRPDSAQQSSRKNPITHLDVKMNYYNFNLKYLESFTSYNLSCISKSLFAYLFIILLILFLVMHANWFMWINKDYLPLGMHKDSPTRHLCPSPSHVLKGCFASATRACQPPAPPIRLRPTQNLWLNPHQPLLRWRQRGFKWVFLVRNYNYFKNKFSFPTSWYSVTYFTKLLQWFFPHQYI